MPTAQTSPPPATAGRGGTLRAFSYDALQPDTLDPHTTQGGPISDVHSAIFSKLLRYEDERSGNIVSDLCEALPEQPDETTLVFRLRRGATFHDTPQFRTAFPATSGRELTAADAQYSIERQLNRNSPQRRRFYRQANWTPIEKIDAPDDATLVIRLSEAVAPFLNFVADRHAFVIPREVVDSEDRIASLEAMIGSGPFVLETFDPQHVVRLRRNDAWFAESDLPAATVARPYLDGCEFFFPPEDDLFRQVSLENQTVDATDFDDPLSLERARTTNLGDIALEETEGGAILASRLLTDRPPFKDDRLRRAIHLAIDREALIERLYPPIGGAASAHLSGPIAASLERWAIPEQDLRRRPGYRTGRERDADAQEAHSLWSSAAGASEVGEIRLFLTGTPKAIREQAGPLLQRQLTEALGVGVRVDIDPSGYALIAAGLERNLEGATDGTVAFTFALEDGGVDLDDCLYPHFRSGAPLNTFRIEDPGLDRLLDRSRREFDVDARRELGLDIQDYLLTNVNARIEYCAPVRRRLAWGYVRDAMLARSHGSAFWLANTWLDTTHPAWRTRAQG